MQKLRRRLQLLERLPQFQPAPSALDQAKSLALRQISDEDLETLIIVARDRDRGVSRILSNTESAAMAAYEATLVPNR